MKKIDKPNKPPFGELLNLAIAWGEAGFAVFPTGKEKQPILAKKEGWTDEQGRGGCWIASTDEEEIKKQFQAAKNRVWGIGCHCGKSGIIVLDGDLYKEDSEDAWELLEDLPETVTSITGGNGIHYWFQYPQDCPVPIGSRSEGLPTNIDVRAWGGYVVMPGSFSGKGKYYFKENLGVGEIDLAPLPPSLLELLIDTNKPPENVEFHNGRFYTEEIIATALDEAGVPFTLSEKFGGSILEFDLHQCLNPDEQHASGSVILLTVYGDDEGRVGYRCHHNSCDGWDWQSVKDFLISFDDDWEFIVPAPNPNGFWNRINKLFSKEDLIFGEMDEEEIASRWPKIDSLHDSLLGFILDEGVVMKATKAGGSNYDDSWLFKQIVGNKLIRDGREQGSKLKGWMHWNGMLWEKEFDILTLFSINVSRQFNHWAKLKIEEIKKLEIEAIEKEAEVKTELKGLTAVKEMLVKKGKNARMASSAKAALEYSGGNLQIGATGKTPFDANPYLLSCSNGVIDMEFEVFRNATPEDYLTKTTGIPWKGIGEPAPRFEKFILEIMGGNRELAEFLQRLLGYATFGLTEEHIFPIFWGGEGRNGKSTLFETLGSVLGEDYTLKASDNILVHKGRGRSTGQATPEIASLQGKRIVWVAEPHEGFMNIALIKELTGGDSIRARQLYQDEFTFAPTHTLFLLTNPKPKFSSDDPAIWERVLLIPFIHRFLDNPDPNNPLEHKRDKRLMKKLKQEKAGILSWLIRGFLAWEENGLQIPELIKMETEKYKGEEDIITEFVADVLLEEDDTETKASEIYECYKVWAEVSGYGQLGKKKFFQKLGKRYPESYDSRKQKTFLGIIVDIEWKQDHLIKKI